MLFRNYIRISSGDSLCFLINGIISVTLLVHAQQFEGDSCTSGDNNGTCQLISSCPSAAKNLTEFKQRPQICGFKEITPIVCCFDKTDTKNNTDENKVISDLKTVNTTGETTGQKAREKCREYSEYIYEWKLPENETDPNKKIKINNCAHIAAPLFIGSETTRTREFPHMALLGFRNLGKGRDWLCGGSLISQEYILTAAHCTNSRVHGDVRWVRLGEQSIDIAVESETQDFAVEEIIRYPDYKPPSMYHDIALLKLDREAILNKFVIPACLHVGYDIKEKNVMATGWGVPRIGESSRLDLAKRVLELFPRDECNEMYGSRRKLIFGILDETMICEGHRTEETGTCQGDSGGPIQVYLREPYCMYDVIGVSSFGKGCNIPGEPSVSTRVSAYISWIESIVWPDD